MHTNIDEMGYKDEKYEEKREEYTDSWEGVAGVRDEHASLSNSSISHSNTFDKSWRCHVSLSKSIIFIACETLAKIY